MQEISRWVQVAIGELEADDVVNVYRWALRAYDREDPRGFVWQRVYDDAWQVTHADAMTEQLWVVSFTNKCTGVAAPWTLLLRMRTANELAGAVAPPRREAGGRG